MRRPPGDTMDFSMNYMSIIISLMYLEIRTEVLNSSFLLKNDQKINVEACLFWASVETWSNMEGDPGQYLYKPLNIFILISIRVIIPYQSIYFFSNDVIKTMFFSTLCLNIELYSLINIDLFLVSLLKCPRQLWNA